jgi:hypothetical protein
MLIVFSLDMLSTALDIGHVGWYHYGVQMSAFRTREDPQPTSEFFAACPCPDGLMQDGT